jgi:hypothetical protein
MADAVTATHAPAPQALSADTKRTLDALLHYRTGGGTDPKLEADFGHEVWHDVAEGRYGEGEAMALLQAYACPAADDREPKAKPKAEHDDAPPKSHKAEHDDDKKPAATAKK